MRHFLLAALIVPLDQASWTLLSYKNLPSHQISYTSGMKISVESSAGPLVHKFTTPRSIKSLSVSALLSKNIQTTSKLGSSGADDFPLRIGLIVAGKKRLNFMQRMAAPEWVKKLYAVAPEGAGIEKILFLNFTAHGQEASFTKRTHPKSELMEERVVGDFKEGRLEQKIEVDLKSDILGLWISIDGDDTKSKFETTLQRIILE